jgi:ubiquinone/menaquinone biosynthesis C-methylase UbiE
VFAGLYDPCFLIGERLGMRRRRRQLLEHVSGRTLEIGSGTGLNLALYPAELDELILAEPEAAMRTRLQRRLRRSGRQARLLDASAERLPLADGSIDTVVCTLVLCTVDQPEVALSEVMRVLSPGGQMLFIEHVRSHSPAVARWQDRLVGPWQRLAVGCRCNRATLEVLAGSGLELEVREASWRGLPPIVRPLIVGRGVRGSDR